MGSNFMLPSGTKVEVTLADDRPILGMGAAALFKTRRADTRLYSFGPRGYFEQACIDMVVSKLAVRSVFNKLELLLAVGVDGTVTTACMRGPYHDVTTLFGGPPIGLDVAQSAFSDFDYNDTPAGMTMVPSRGSLGELLSEDATLIVADRGVVIVTVGTDALKTLPTWAGTATSAGEVWQSAIPAQTPGEAPRRQYFVGYHKAAVQVVPASLGDDTTREWQDWLLGMQVTAA